MGRMGRGDRRYGRGPGLARKSFLLSGYAWLLGHDFRRQALEVKETHDGVEDFVSFGIGDRPAESI